MKQVVIYASYFENVMALTFQSPFPNDNKKVLTMDNPTENTSNWKALPMLKNILIIFMSFKNAPVGKGA